MAGQESTSEMKFEYDAAEFFEVGKRYKNNVHPFNDCKYKCEWQDEKWIMFLVTDETGKEYPTTSKKVDMRLSNWSEIVPDKIIKNERYVYLDLENDSIIVSPEHNLHIKYSSLFKHLRTITLEYNKTQNTFKLTQNNIADLIS